MPKKCVGVGCKEKFEKGKLPFYRFPKKDVNRRIKWIQAIKRVNVDVVSGKQTKWEPSDHSWLCGDHFVMSMCFKILSSLINGTLYIFSRKEVRRSSSYRLYSDHLFLF